MKGYTMKTRTSSLWLIMAIFAVIFSFSLVACSGDSDSGSSDELPNYELESIEEIK